MAPDLAATDCYKVRFGVVSCCVFFIYFAAADCYEVRWGVFVVLVAFLCTSLLFIALNMRWVWVSCVVLVVMFFLLPGTSFCLNYLLQGC